MSERGKKLFWLLLCSALLGFWLRTQALVDGLEREETTDASETVPAIKDEDIRLFDALWREGLIHSDDGLFLQAVFSDHLEVVKQRRESQNEPLLDQDKVEQWRRLLHDLHHTDTGSVIRRGIDEWNRSHRLVAVRSSMGSEILWRGEVAVGTGWIPAVMRPLGVPEEYGFIHGGRLPRQRLQNWQGIVEAQSKNRIVGTILNVGKQPLTIQVIGRSVRFSPQPDHPLSPRCSGRTTIDQLCTPDRAEGWVARYDRLPVGERIEIDVSPALPEGLNRIPGLNVERTPSKRQLFQWHPLRTHRGQGRDLPKIVTSDGVELSNQKGVPTEFTRQNGLVPVVGFGTGDAYSLLGLLAGSRISRDLPDNVLTVDSRLQQVADEVLTQSIKSFQTEGKKGKVWPEDEREESERRAALVVLDADHGDILAVTGHPLPAPTASAWDLASFAKVYPDRNPLRVHAWQGLDRHNAPGSTFKLVTALTAVRSDIDRSKDAKTHIKQLIEGIEKKRFYSKTGMRLDCQSYDPLRFATSGASEPASVCVSPGNRRDKGIDNFFINRVGYETPDMSFRKGTASFGMGLREALRDSLNVWFVHLAMLMDAQAAGNYDARYRNREVGNLVKKPDLSLVRTARLLGFGFQSMDIFPEEEKEWKLHRYRPRSGSEGDVLFAQPGTLDLMRREGYWVWTLGQNSIGQGVVASPLQMARVAAAIGSRQVVTPRLSAYDFVNKPIELQVDDDLYERLRAGMRAVVEPGGTAGDAFVILDQQTRQRVFGKTGTAQVGGVKKRIEGRERYNTAWFVGWMEPNDTEKRRLAFACMVTHARGGGGSVCAPMVASLLKRIQESSKTDTGAEE